jgi:predicted  nucleic acid-binding Zn-ribbon protein
MAQKKEAITASKEQLKEREEDLDRKKNELSEITEETKIEEEKLRAKSEKIESFIEPRLLGAFKRIRKNARNGLAVVTIQRDACGGCFNKIPPQRQMDIASRKKIIVCEYCGRILVDQNINVIDDIAE